MRRLVLSLCLSLLAGVAWGARGDCRGMRATSWHEVVAETAEPGERLVVDGTVYTEDGTTPVAAARIFVYQTDATGYYSPGGRDESDARLCTVMVTDSDGRYRFETVRPGPYPTGGVPAHVHYEVWGDGWSRQRFDLQFADDPLLRGRQIDDRPWTTVRPVQRGADGVWSVVRDLWVKID